MSFGPCRITSTFVIPTAMLPAVHRAGAPVVQYEDEDVCFVGVPLGISDGELGIQEIRLTADWEDFPSAWELGSISRIDFGDRYSSRLLAVATERGMPEA